MSQEQAAILSQRTDGLTQRSQEQSVSPLVRWGWLMISPQRFATVSNAASARLDRRLLVMMYVVGVHTDDLLERVASLSATRDLNGVIGLASTLAWSLLPIVAALWLLESILRRDRSHHAGTLLAPLVFVAVLHHLADRLALGRVALPAAWQVDLLGIAWAALLALRLREILSPMRAADASADRAAGEELR